MSAPDPAALAALARARQPALVAATQRLVRIDSQTPPSDTAAVVAAAAAMLEGLPGLDLRVIGSVAPVVNLVARLDGGLPGRRLVLSGHLDTYPVGDPAGWTQDPLGGAVADGRLYGRGSADMKGACVGLIEVVRLFAEHMRPFPGEILLVLAGDEERMGELGTQWLIDHVPGIGGDGVIVADVGGPACVRLGEKGMIWLELEAEGRQAHGAHVHAGQNALDLLADALLDLRSLARMPVATPPEAAAVMAAAAGVAGADGPAARQVMQQVTVNLGCLSGGTSPNLVPAGAEAGLDIRIPLGLSVADVERAIEARLRAHGAVRHRVTRRYEPSWTARDSAVARACAGAAAQVLGGPAWFDMRIGGSDARLWRRAGFETVVQGLTPRNLGAPDESLAVEELWQLAAVHAVAARAFLGAGG